MSPLQIKLAIYAAVFLIVIGAYFSWKHHIEAIQHEKDMAQFERSSKELLQRKMVEVKIENDALQERKNNAIETYAKHSADLQRDAAALANRMSKHTSCGRNTVPGKADDRQSGEISDTGSDQSIAIEIMALFNKCELWISQIPEK